MCDHLYKCWHATRQTLWEDSMLTMMQWLHQQHTDPILVSLITSMLHRWHNDTPTSLPFPTDDPMYAQIAQDQYRIGWGAFMKGFVAPLLINGQDTFLHSIGSDCLGTYWACTLCHHLWKIFETFWEQRNQFIHTTPDDSEEKLSQALSQVIVNKYSVGPERLPRSRKAYFNHNLQ